jgi:hypothetical protein
LLGRAPVLEIATAAYMRVAVRDIPAGHIAAVEFPGRFQRNLPATLPDPPPWLSRHSQVTRIAWAKVPRHLSESGRFLIAKRSVGNPEKPLG